MTKFRFIFAFSIACCLTEAANPQNIPVSHIETIAVLPHRAKHDIFSSFSVRIEGKPKDGQKTVVLDFEDLQSTYSPVRVHLTPDVDELHRGKLKFVVEVFYALRTGVKMASDDPTIAPKGVARYQWKTTIPDVIGIDGAKFVLLDASGYHKLPIKR